MPTTTHRGPGCQEEAVPWRPTLRSSGSPSSQVRAGVRGPVLLGEGSRPAVWPEPLPLLSLLSVIFWDQRGLWEGKAVAGRPCPSRLLLSWPWGLFPRLSFPSG